MLVHHKVISSIVSPVKCLLLVQLNMAARRTRQTIDSQKDGKYDWQSYAMSDTLPHLLCVQPVNVFVYLFLT